MKKIIKICSILVCFIAFSAIAQDSGSSENSVFLGQPATLESVLGITQTTTTLRTYNCEVDSKKKIKLNVNVNGVPTDFVSITECLGNVSITYTCTGSGMRVTRAADSTNCGK